MKKLIHCILLCTLCPVLTFSQDADNINSLNNKVRVGLDFTLEIGLGVMSSSKNLPKVPGTRRPVPGMFNLRTSIGLAYDGLIRWQGDHTTNYTPMYQIGFGLSTGRGMLGSSGAWNNRNDINFELVHSVNLIVGWNGRVEQKPFQFFSSNHGTPLSIDYRNYISLGTILIHNPRIPVQRCGSFAFSWENNSVFYTNDGGPLHHELGIGDRWDRYWNGGLAIYFNSDEDDTHFLFCYDRYTGWAKNAYKLGGQLKTDFVSYEDERSYNKGHWKLKVWDQSTGVGGFVALTDSKTLDFQNVIHKVFGFPWHPNYFPVGFQMGTIVNH